jgi:hypothetical protein
VYKILFGHTVSSEGINTFNSLSVSGKNYNNYEENIRRQQKKFRRPRPDAWDLCVTSWDYNQYLTKANTSNYITVKHCHQYVYTHKMSNKMQHQYLDFITRSLYMFRVLSVPIIRSTITAVDSHWYNMLRRIVNLMVTSVLKTVLDRAVGPTAWNRNRIVNATKSRPKCAVVILVNQK